MEGKARQIQSVEIPDIVPLTTGNAYLIFARINYTEGPAETYAIPLLRSSSEGEASSLKIHPANPSEEIIFKDALADQQFLAHLLDAIANGCVLARNQRAGSRRPHRRAGIPLAACSRTAHTIADACGAEQHLGRL